MKIVAISDTHGKHRQIGPIPEADVLIHAGDFMHTGTDPRELLDFNAWLGEQPAQYRVVIAGNHDMLAQIAPGYTRSLLTNAIYLENSGVTINGCRFWGSPTGKSYAGWAFGATDEELLANWERIPYDTHVLITHTPPYGILDQVKVGGEHLGCKHLSNRLARLHPPVHVFGHIHSGYGRDLGLGDTHLRESGYFMRVNAAMLGEGNVLLHNRPPQELDVEMTQLPAKHYMHIEEATRKTSYEDVRKRVAGIGPHLSESELDALGEEDALWAQINLNRARMFQNAMLKDLTEGRVSWSVPSAI